MRKPGRYNCHLEPPKKQMACEKHMVFKTRVKNISKLYEL